MATIRPSNSSSFPDKTVNPVFPPMSHSIANGIRPPSFPPNISTSTQNSSQINAPIFPSSNQSLSNVQNTKINPTLTSSNVYNTNTNSSQPVASTNPTLSSSNVFNRHTVPTQSPSNVFNTNTNSFQPVASINPTVPSSNVFNTNTVPTPPPSNVFNTHTVPTPPPSNVFNIHTIPTTPLPNISTANGNSTPPLNVLNTKINPTISLPTPYNASPNPISQTSNIFNSNTTSTPTPPLPNIYNANINPTSSPPYGYNTNTSPPPNILNTKVNSTSPPSSSSSPTVYPMSQNPSLSHPSNIYNPLPTHQAPLSQPSNNDMVDLLKEKSVVTPYAEEPPVSPLLNEENQQMNCSPEVMRCSLNVIPQTKDLLNKSRLPLGILIHPFKDLESLSVIQGTKIVRCDSCKSYINPFITFLDNTRWRCSICFRVNDLPQEFLFDPITKTYGDPSRRPEVRFGTVEYTATADYMARPPQPAMYLFLLDVSHNAIQTGYLQSFCDILLESLNGLPGDARTKIGFLTYDSRIHFYDLSDRHNGTFRIMIAPDLDNKPEDFLPMPDGLMVTLCECRSTIETFLNELPKIYQDNHETDSALGSALQIAGKLLDQTGGRITVIQTRIPNINPGALQELVGSGGQTAKEPTNIGPTSDFYKKLSLDYASLQIACDLFLLNSHHIDLATLSCISKYSGGEVKYYAGFHSVQRPHEVERFENDLRRYLQRKIGFEAVMRLRSPPAMAIHTFHGSGFVRSVDLLVLPNINPDAAFGMQVAVEDSLAHYTSVTFQAALLYTSSKSERRIRVHTLSLPVSANLTEICSNADQEAIVSLVAKMATDRSTTSSIQEARDAMTNVACDILKACLSHNLSNRAFSLLVPYSLRLIPLYMLSMIKSTAFRAGGAPRLDDRAYYLDLCKTLPTQYLMQILYPDLYPIHTIEDKSQIIQDGEDELHIPQRVHLSYQNIDSHGAYILDTSEYIYVYIGKAISDHFVQNVFNLGTFSALPLDSYSLPELENPLSMKIHNFLSYLIQSRPHGIALHIMREDSSHRHLFTRHLVDDKSESTMSYVEFLRYIREQIVK
ncbi:unnamed protein product [Rotaria sordida]|uniref:Uncharacterized protein n=1 Tax=Rotaria sordida TaxID=392033 RepID=A0A814GKW5_9BILA|nr:unnamed protein product [Rotaria sordida]